MPTGEISNGDDVAARRRGELEAFVLRARRIQAHSLASDWDTLAALANAPHQVIVTASGERRLRQEFPAEEVVESAAARVRPLTLIKDPCAYLKALAAVEYFCRELPDDGAWVQAARKEWLARTEPSAAPDGGYHVMTGDAATGVTATLTDQKLAMAWIYGDVVHHDSAHRREAEPFGLAERFRAAVPLVCWLMVAAIELLNYIKVLQSDGVLALDPEVFDQEVVLETTSWERPVRVFTAPVGTPPPADALTPFGAEWTPLPGSSQPEGND